MYECNNVHGWVLRGWSFVVFIYELFSIMSMVYGWGADFFRLYIYIWYSQGLGSRQGA